jgi:hypothetical protein
LDSELFYSVLDPAIDAVGALREVSGSNNVVFGSLSAYPSGGNNLIGLLGSGVIVDRNGVPLNYSEEGDDKSDDKFRLSIWFGLPEFPEPDIEGIFDALRSGGLYILAFLTSIAFVLGGGFLIGARGLKPGDYIVCGCIVGCVGYGAFWFAHLATL